jgi:iron complex outermembrane receptor protein
MRKASLFFSLLFIATCALAQQVITGRVTDNKGVGADGISVREKGTSAGTISNKDGYYSLRVSKANVTLVFSGVGFTEQEVITDGKKSVDVTLVSSMVTLTGIEIVGTRSLKRSVTETPVPVDIIPISKVLNQQGFVEINSILHYLAPSFNSNRQSGADGADHIDPATIRGLGPDQTLVLVNGKRWHQSSLVNLYGTRGRGNSGTDLNAIPAAAIERIEILRDGASAQYGSDAIAGVINIILKSSVNEVTANSSFGKFITGYGHSLKLKNISPTAQAMPAMTDGFTVDFNGNYGVQLKNNGFLNLTAEVLKKDKTYRPNNESLYPGSNYREKFGDGSYRNYSLFFNNVIPMKGKTEFYSFGGFNRRDGDAFAFTRDATSERNVISIYPNGFNPQIQSNINDLSLSMGIRTKLGVWNADFNGVTGSNRFHYKVDNTLNSSMVASSPIHFDAGGFQLSQSTLSANFSRSFSKIAQGLNLAMGTEFRYEQYQIFAGETTSWKQYGPVVFSINGPGDTTFRPGGSQGFPGFQPKDVVKEGRANIGNYVDAELDITKQWLVAAAIRNEHYSDFGWTTDYKLATRIKANDNLSLRGSLSTGFRAPSLPQIHFSSTFTNVVAGQIFDQLIAPNTSEIAKAVGIPELKEETSTNFSAGFVAKLFRRLNLSVDGYWVKVKNRVVLTGLFDNNDDKIGTVLQNLNVGAAQFFTNAVDTRTGGVDIIATYNMHMGEEGRLNALIAANFNDMSIDKVKTTALLAGKEDIYFGAREQAFLLASAPKHKIGLSVDYSYKFFNAMIRATHFSEIKLVNFADEKDIYNGKTVMDLVLSFKAANKWTISAGCNNFLDVYPTRQDPGLTESGGMWDAVQMGFDGAFYFLKLGLRMNLKK